MITKHQPTVQNLTLILNSDVFEFQHYMISAKKLFFSRKMAAKHYLEKGWKQGFSPGKRFDNEWFLQEYPEVAASGICPLLYYLKHCDEKCMHISSSEQQNTALIMRSTLFDDEHYSSQVQTPFPSRCSAALHYLAGAGRTSPSQYFDAAYYLDTYQDVASKGLNPLLHYEKFGAREGRHPYGEVHNEALKQADDLFRKGEVQQASSRTRQLLASQEDNTPAQDAAKLLSAEIALLSGDYALTESIGTALLDKGWKALRPFDYNRACRLQVQALCEQGKHQQARDIVIHAYQHLDTWHSAALTQLRHTLITQADLALFSSIITPAIAKNDAFTTHAQLQYSLAARDTGNMPLALEMIKKRYTEGVSRLHEFGCEPPGANISWQAEARLALGHMKKCFDDAGIPFFLISGTLLGCIRDDDIISHDKDIDVGVMDDVSITDIKAAFRGKGRFTVLPDIHDRLVRVWHANGVMADVFVHWENGSQLYHEGRKTGWWNTPFSLTSKNFLGETYLIPSDTNTYLEENYGNWKVPEENFDTFSDTPNMYIANHNELVWYFYKELLDSYMLGNDIGYCRAWKSLCIADTPSQEAQTIYHMSI